MAENTQIVEYESNGEIVKISPTMIKKYLVKENLVYGINKYL